VSTARTSATTKLPQEIVEMIISYFTYDTRSLLACSMTCYSWYTAAVHHLHHTLTTDDYGPRRSSGGHMWPRPLQKAHELGLLPLVKRFQVRMGIAMDAGFNSEWLSERGLCYFSALSRNLE